MINKRNFLYVLFFVFIILGVDVFAQTDRERPVFRVMEYNVENLFDCQHDSLKDDYEFLPEGSYNWTRSRYWKKLNAVARGIVLASSKDDNLLVPDIIGLCEVENDSVLFDLTRRSLLRGAGYEYVMTNSPDRRGVDVALMYQPVAFRLENHYSIKVDTLPDMRPTRDILYVKGETMSGMIHVYVVHAPSRRGGERATRPNRLAVMQRLVSSIDSVYAEESEAHIVVMGDFNAYEGDASIKYLENHRLIDVTGSAHITPDKDVKGTYRYQGEWGNLDHIFVSPSFASCFVSSAVASHPELLEEDTKYGGYKPNRFFRGPVSKGGYSDHLPLMAEFLIDCQ